MANRLGQLSTIGIYLDSSVPALFLPHFARSHHSMLSARGVASLRCALVHHDDGSRGISWFVLHDFAMYEADSWWV